MPSLKLVSSYLNNRKQRVKINDKFSSLEEIIFGVRQESILGLLLFNISLCDLSLFTTDTDIANYADDIRSVYENTTCKVIERLRECSGDMFTWFEIDGMKVENDGMKANPEKCYLLVSKEKTSTSVISDNLKN